MNREAVLAAEDAREAALIAHDVATLERLLDDGLVWIHSSGLVESKSGFFARAARSDIRYIAFRRSEENIRLYGAIAINYGVYELDARVDGVLTRIRNCFTNMWLFSDAGPRLISTQSTRIP